MRWVLDMATLPGPGLYRFRLETPAWAAGWLALGDFHSAIAYPGVATALRELTGMAIPVNRARITMHPGDEALVFRHETGEVSLLIRLE